MTWKKILTKEQIKEFKNYKKEKLICCHFGLGTLIRNRYLWNRQKIYYLFIEQNISHPDDMSNIILEKFHEYLQQK